MLEAQAYRLLYVEDEEDIREMAVEYLDDFFKEIYVADNGEDALKVYYEKKPDIIITDIEMPKMNGLKLASIIRKEDNSTPIIISTAYTSKEYLFEAMELNLIKYLLKPVQENALEEALRECYMRIESSSSSIVHFSPSIGYDIFNHTLVSDKEFLSLTASQMKFLDLLIKYKSRAISYVEIENHIWWDREMSESALRSLVHETRNLIGKKAIQNVSKTGYKINLYEK